MTNYVKKTLWEKMLEWDITAGSVQEEVLQIVPLHKVLHCVGPYVSCNDNITGALHKWELYVNDHKTKSSYFKNVQSSTDNIELVLEPGDKLSLRIYNNSGSDTYHFEAWLRGFLGEK